jgi:AAA domain
VTSPEAILRYLAGLARGKRTGAAASLDALASPRDYVWLGDHPLIDDSGRNPPPPGWYDRPLDRVFTETVVGIFDDDVDDLYRYTVPAKMRMAGLDRLASIDSLDPRTTSLRAGAMWLVGRRRVGDATESILLPILTRRVLLHPTGGVNALQPEWRSDIEVHPLFADAMTDDEQAQVLTREMTPTLARALCGRLGLPAPTVIEREKNPLSVVSSLRHRSVDEPDISYLGAGTAVFVVAPDAPTTVAAGLQRWARENLKGTAFSRLYGTDPINEDDSDAQVETSMPVNARQREAIARSRLAEVSVVSGPPGTGKTHLVAATAIDAIARGGAVLVATQSDSAAESVCEVLERYPSPPFVRFGRAEHRQQVAERLSTGRERAPSAYRLHEAETREETARGRRDELREFIRSALEREAALTEGLRHRDSLGMLTADAPGVRRDDVDLDELDKLLVRAGRSGRGFNRWRATRAGTKLRRLVDAPRRVALDTIGGAIRVARSEREVERVLATGGTALGPLWADLAAAEAQWQDAFADLVDVRRRHTGRVQRRRARASVAALANVLRTGAGRRPTLLSDIESDDFLDLLPLWIGTVDEVERTLPVIPALFDLVILDEASQIDQIHAAGVLCRAERVMVVGDPKQLRHVSFVSDREMETLGQRHGIDESPLRRLLDIHRNSVFDVAAAASPVIWLDEHFRSVPHLIDFSSRYFYDNELRLMTQHPSVEGRDAIDQVRVDGERVDGVNHAEIDIVRDLIADLAYRIDTGSIGVVTPFRKQADAIVEMVLGRFSLTQIRQFGLRTGTVHSFQGTERDTMIISLGVGPGDLARARQFIENRNLFNVMVTRARRRIVLVHSFDPDELPPGLLADYFRFVDDPPDFEKRQHSASPWVSRIADALSDTEDRVVTDYPVAGWTVDIALGSDATAIGVECTVHPDGPDAHIERHLTLRRAGWTLTDAFQSRWMLDPEQAAIQLAVEYRRRVEAAGPPGSGPYGLR